MDNVDILRFVAIALGNTVFFVAARVVVNYYRATKIRLSSGEFRGILPLYVYLISLSYIILVGSSIYLHVQNIGKRITVTFVASMLSYIFGLVGLWIALQYERNKVTKNKIQEAVENELLRQTIFNMLAEDKLIEQEEKDEGNG